VRKILAAILWLILITPAGAQYWNYDFNLMRGDARTLKFQHYTDYDSSRIEFVIKTSNGLDADTLVSKKNQLAGGDTTEIKSIFRTDKTTINVYLKNSDTKNLQYNLLYYDLISAPVNDSTEKSTLYHGKIFLKPKI
jgi:hypothetical protein